MLACGKQIQDGIAHLLGGFDSGHFGRARRRQIAVGPLTSRTRAPRRSADSARAYPMRPLERFVRYRTGSIFSRVGPAVMSTRFSREILSCSKSFKDGSDNGFVFGETSLAHHAAGEISGAGLDHFHTPLAQDFQIRLGCRMIPHVDVHGRRDHDRCRGGEVKSSQEVSGDALREVGQNIRRSRNHDERINRLCDGDMLDGRIDVGFMLFAGREHPGDHFFSGERGKGKRLDEFLSGAGHDDLHANAAIL